MAQPFKRICLRASRPKPTQWQPLRCISSTTRLAAEETSPSPPSAANAASVIPTAGQSRQPSRIDSPADLRRTDTSNLSSLAHRELEQHREIRELSRIAAWEMPLLSQLAKPFTPPTETQVLRWRYTTYLGESHPAANKVVVEFQPDRLLDLTPPQREKLLKLAGPRYNPETKTIKMACESCETQAMNKRYLADTINTLIAECKDPEADSFSDVPLDTRHHKQKKQIYKFPQEWVLTPERKQMLEDKRKVAMLEEGKRVEEDKLVGGLRAIEEARKVQAAQVAEPVAVEARQAVSKGKAGRRNGGKGR